MADTVTIHLMRHEQTAANQRHQYIGWTDEPIVSTPPQQPHCPRIVHGSDLLRCRQTAAGYFPHAIYKAYAGLRELHFGDFEMKTYEQLQHNQTYRKWIDAPLETNLPNGEKFGQFEQRVMDTVQQIIKQPGVYTFVVHGGVIRLLLARYGAVEQTFQQVTAGHRICYTLQWSQFQQWQEGARCTFSSEEPLTASDNT